MIVGTCVLAQSLVRIEVPTKALADITSEFISVQVIGVNAGCGCQLAAAALPRCPAPGRVAGCNTEMTTTPHTIHQVLAYPRAPLGSRHAVSSLLCCSVAMGRFNGLMV